MRAWCAATIKQTLPADRGYDGASGNAGMDATLSARNARDQPGEQQPTRGEKAAANEEHPGARVSLGCARHAGHGILPHL